MILEKAILYLTHSFIMLEIDQTYFEILAVFTLQNFKSMFGDFSTLWMKGLKKMPVYL